MRKDSKSLPADLVASAFQAANELAWPMDAAPVTLRAIAQCGYLLLGVDFWSIFGKQIHAGLGATVDGKVIYPVLTWTADVSRFDIEPWQDFCLCAAEAAIRDIHETRIDNLDPEYRKRLYVNVCFVGEDEWKTD